MGSISGSIETSVPGNGVAGRGNAPKGNDSALFTPFSINHGTLTLSHRIILAPLTRDRGLPLDPNADPLTSPNRIWYPDDLLIEYYTQRTTPGGFLITEGIPPNLEGNGMPGVPGLFHPSQVTGWKKVVSAAHAKGGFIYAQLWNAGRASMPYHTGLPTISASATPYEGDDIYNHPPPGTSTPLKYRDYPPIELSIEARGTQRLETWGYLCKEIKKRMELSYVHFVEARYEQVHSVEEKNKFLSEWGLAATSLSTFKTIFGATPFVSAGGWSDKNAWGIIEDGKYDALAIGRLFLSTPDLVERMKEGKPLNAYDRSRFYGPFDVRKIGYTNYPVWADVGKSGKALVK